MLASRFDRASLCEGDVNRHTNPPTSVVCYEPIDERTTIVDVLSVDSDLRVLDAGHHSAGFRQVDLETLESHEEYFAGYFQDSSEERVRVSGLSSWSAMEKPGASVRLRAPTSLRAIAPAISVAARSTRSDSSMEQERYHEPLA